MSGPRVVPLHRDHLITAKRAYLAHAIPCPRCDPLAADHCPVGAGFFDAWTREWVISPWSGRAYDE